MGIAIDQARAALMRALEQLDLAERDLEGEAERCDLVIVYSVGRREAADDGDWHEVAGWSSTPGPKWLHAALLRRAAEAHELTELSRDDEE
jgi:hypothetical protein